MTWNQMSTIMREEHEALEALYEDLERQQDLAIVARIAAEDAELDAQQVMRRPVLPELAPGFKFITINTQKEVA